MIIPKPPAVKGFRFHGVEQHQLRHALASEIRDTIKALIHSTTVSGWQGVFYKFIDCIPPGNVRTPARLPYQSAGPNATVASRIACVHARLSWAIQCYWSLCLDGTDNTVTIRRYLEDLRAWASHDIEKCKIKGSPRTGYELEAV